MRVAAIGDCPAALDSLLIQDTFYRKGGNQAVEQIKQLKDRRGRIISQQVCEVAKPKRDDRYEDNLVLQNTTGVQQMRADQALLASLAQLADAQPTRQHRQEDPQRGFSREEFDFLNVLFGGRGR